MDFCVPFSDLTEIGELTTRKKVGEPVDYLNYPTTEQCLVDAEEKIQTELAFLHIPHYYNSSVQNTYDPLMKMVLAHGWQEVAMTLNWHEYHKGDHPIGLWLKKFDRGNVFGPLPNRKINITPGYKVNDTNVVFAFGCGGRLVDGMPENFKSLRRCEPKALTLLRIPKEQVLTELEIRWLGKNRYRQLWNFGTSQAHYYVNGWWPEDYNKEYERAYWHGWDEHKRSLLTPRRARIEED